MTPIWTMLDRKVQAAAVAAAARCSAGDELGLKRNVSEARSEAPALSEKGHLPRSLEETARVSRRPQSDRGSGFEKQRAPAGGVCGHASFGPQGTFRINCRHLQPHARLASPLCCPLAGQGRGHDALSG